MIYRIESTESSIESSTFEQPSDPKDSAQILFSFSPITTPDLRASIAKNARDKNVMRK